MYGVQQQSVLLLIVIRARCKEPGVIMTGVVGRRSVATHSTDLDLCATGYN